MRYILYALLFPFYLAKMFIMLIVGIAIFPIFCLVMMIGDYNMDNMEENTKQWLEWTFMYVIH